MKKILFSLIVVAGLIIYGCNKTGDTPPAASTLTGTWKYVGYSGGIAGLSFQPVNNVEAYIQVDTAGSRVLTTDQGTQGCATFTASQCFFCCGTNAITLADTITLSNKVPFYNDTKLFATIANDTLRVSPLLNNCVDCATSYYVLTSKHLDWCTDVTTNK